MDGPSQGRFHHDNSHLGFSQQFFQVQEGTSLVQDGNSREQPIRLPQSIVV